MCRLQFYRNIQKKSTNPSIRTLVSTLQCRFLCVFRILPYAHSANVSAFFKELCSAPVACVCSPGHPLARYDTLTKKKLTGNFIACSPRQIPDSIFTIQNSILVNLLPEQRFFAENIESAFALAKAQLGYTLYPDIFPAKDPDLCYIPITNLPRISFGVYCQHKHDQPVLKRFLTLISQWITSNLSRSDSSF